MTTRTLKFFCAALLLLIVPLDAMAQLGALKKKIQEKAGVSKPAAGKPATQWKASERVAPFTAADLDRFIAQWKAELKNASMSEAERQRLDQEREQRAQQAAEKKDRWKQCLQTSVTADEMMRLSQKMQQRMIELSRSGDQNAPQKAAEEYQKATQQMMEKKCGPEPKEDAAESQPMADVRMKEWVAAYLMVRKDKGPEAAAGVVLATEAETKLLEARLTQLQQLASEDGLTKSN